MAVTNVHARTFPGVDPVRIGALIDGLSSNSDRLWPASTWPAMRLDGALASGARGGHGPIRYRVEAYRPGHSVRFGFLAPSGFRGHHRFELVSDGDGPPVLRHTLDMTVHGLARLSWPLVFRPLHDALIEDALARAQHELGIPAQASPWSVYVRFLRRLLGGGRR